MLLTIVEPILRLLEVGTKLVTVGVGDERSPLARAEDLIPRIEDVALEVDPLSPLLVRLDDVLKTTGIALDGLAVLFSVFPFVTFSSLYSLSFIESSPRSASCFTAWLSVCR